MEFTKNTGKKLEWALQQDIKMDSQIETQA